MNVSLLQFVKNIFVSLTLFVVSAVSVLFLFCAAWQVSKLEALGFSKSDCENALTVCHGQLDKAATWLTKNVKPIMATGSHSRLYISGFEVL